MWVKIKEPSNMVKVQSYVSLVMCNMKLSIVGNNKGSPNVTSIQLYVMLVQPNVMMEP